MNTLYSYLKPKSEDLDSLRKKYNAQLELVYVLIGNIPNVNTIMEMWPTSFMTYNLFVPNLMNMPGSLFGSKSVKSLMSLAMYHSSSGAECNYCTAHSCTLALRRGLDESFVHGNSNPKEVAVINFSRKMSQVPCTITKDDFRELQKHCSAKEVETVSMAIVLMGFLNKFMDTMAVELEQETIDDVSELLHQTGWNAGKHAGQEVKKSHNSAEVKKDNLTTYLKVIRQAPGAIKLENKWTKGVPKELNEVNDFLNSNINHSFSILSKIKRKKSLRAMATILRDNFSESNTFIGLQQKIMSGLIFSQIVENRYLEIELLILAKNNDLEIDENLLNRNPLKQFDDINLSEQEILILNFTQKASTSPVNINESLVNEITSKLPDEAIIELVTWLSILQALHRLEKLPVE